MPGAFDTGDMMRLMEEERAREQALAEAEAARNLMDPEGYAATAPLPEGYDGATAQGAFAAGISDPLQVPSALYGLYDPEGRDAWREQTAESPAGAIGGAISGMAALAPTMALGPLGAAGSGAVMLAGSDLIDYAGGGDAPDADTATSAAMGALPAVGVLARAMPKTSLGALGAFGVTAPDALGEAEFSGRDIQDQIARQQQRRAQLEAQLDDVSSVGQVSIPEPPNWDPTMKPIRSEAARTLQQTMAKDGVPINVDGLWGGGSQRAYESWAARKRAEAPQPDATQINRLRSEIDSVTDSINSLQEEASGARQRSRIEDIDAKYEPDNFVEQALPYAALGLPLVAGGGLGYAGTKYMSGLAKSRADRLSEVASRAEKLPRVPKPEDLGIRAGVVDAAYDVMGRKSPLGRAPYNQSNRGLFGMAGQGLFGSREKPLTSQSLAARYPDVVPVAGSSATAMGITEISRSKAQEEADRAWAAFQASGGKDLEQYERYKSASTLADQYANIQKAELGLGAGYILGRFKRPQATVADNVDGAAIARIMEQRGAVEQGRGEAFKRAQAAAKAAQTRARNAGIAQSGADRNQSLLGPTVTQPQIASRTGQGQPQTSATGSSGNVPFDPPPPAASGTLSGPSTRLPDPQPSAAASASSSPRYSTARRGAFRDGLAARVEDGQSVQDLTLTDVRSMIPQGRNLPKDRLQTLLANTKSWAAKFQEEFGRLPSAADIMNMPKNWNGKDLLSVVGLAGLGAAGVASGSSTSSAGEGLSQAELDALADELESMNEAEMRSPRGRAMLDLLR